MKPEALVKECLRAIQTQPGCGFIVAIGSLKGKGWPRGNCVGSDSRGRFYSYDAFELLGRLIVYGVATIQPLEAGGSTIEIPQDSEAGASVLDQDATARVCRVIRKVSRRR